MPLRPFVLAGMLLISAGLPASAAEVALATLPPVVVRTEPRAGATNVAASVSEIRVTFSRPMRDRSWSWVKLSDASFPGMTGNPRFLDDRLTCVLPVSLEPGMTYAIWLNKPPFENFQDEDGHKAVPYLLAFATKPGARHNTISASRAPARRYATE